jgi:hypothetical protein
MNLQMDTAHAKLAERASKYARRITSSSLDKRDVWIAYFACFIPAITYTFSVTHHSAKKLRKLQSAPTRATLMKLGFNRNTAHAVAYGPSRYGALGLRDWSVEQGIASLTMLIRHLRGHTEQGRLLLIAMSWWHVYSGSSYQLLFDPHPPLVLGNHHLFTVLRSFLREINGSFCVAAIDDMLPSPTRFGDICLMDVVAALPSVSTSDRNRFNRVRLFHCVSYLSEISSADGSSLARDAWTGTRPRHSPLMWPYQPKPGPRSYRSWRRLLAHAFFRSHCKWTGYSLKDLTLRTSLTDWLPNTSWLRSRWSTFFSISTRRCFPVFPMDTTLLISLSASVSAPIIPSVPFLWRLLLWLPTCLPTRFPSTSVRKLPFLLRLRAPVAFSRLPPLFRLLTRGRNTSLGCLLGRRIFFSMLNSAFPFSNAFSSLLPPILFFLLPTGGLALSGAPTIV